TPKVCSMLHSARPLMEGQIGSTFHLELFACLTEKNTDARLSMPRLIVQRSGQRRKIPPCGRLIEYREPHSPLQKLIDSQRRRYGFSGRDLAAKIGVSQSTLWIWLHNVNGYPHPKAFKHQHLQRLSRALKIP